MVDPCLMLGLLGRLWGQHAWGSLQCFPVFQLDMKMQKQNGTRCCLSKAAGQALLENTQDTKKEGECACLKEAGNTLPPPSSGAMT